MTELKSLSQRLSCGKQPAVPLPVRPCILPLQLYRREMTSCTGYGLNIKNSLSKMKGALQYDRKRVQTCFILFQHYAPADALVSKGNCQVSVSCSRALLIGGQIYSTCKKQLEQGLHQQQSEGINSDNETGKVQGRNDLCACIRGIKCQKTLCQHGLHQATDGVQITLSLLLFLPASLSFIGFFPKKLQISPKHFAIYWLSTE